MNKMLHTYRSAIDWILFAATVPILGAGLVTMNSFVGNSTFFKHQLIWIPIAFIIFFVASWIDWSFLKATSVTIAIFLASCALLALLFVVGHISKGAESWFRLGFFSIEPSEPAQIALIILLAKYFSRRHVEIRNVRHILVSGFYSLVVFVLILIQPDFGAAIIIFFIWLGMVLVSGISKRHLFAVGMIGVVSFAGLWMYAFKDYQKARILTFIHPLADIHGAGYNAYQSTIAVGSGQMLGKGIGYGTQSKLNFLPEYQTDFIFAAFAEEWGFVGVMVLFALYGVLIWRILYNASHGASNFDVLYGTGVAILFMTHFVINVGMNIGLLPVTGVTVPFMSYGGSHLITEFAALGILMGMRKHGRTIHRDLAESELIGTV